MGKYNTGFAGIALAFSLILAGSLAHRCWSQDKPAQGKAHTETRAASNGAASAGSAVKAGAAATCTQAQLWALACPALLTLQNGHKHDILWCTDATPENVTYEKRMLIEGWDIQSREDLLDRLGWFIREGQRAEFDLMAKVAQNDTVMQALRARLPGKDVAEFDEKISIAREYGPELGLKSLLGWDYCRYINLCRSGTLCSFLSQDEAWAKIMPAAQLLQKSFSSWSDLGNNYLIGRRFWQAHEDKQKSFENNYKLLLSDPKSPWNTIPWKTDLSTKSHK